MLDIDYVSWIVPWRHISLVYALHTDCIKTTVTQILDIDYVCQKFTCVGGKCKFLVKNGQTHNR